jgi:uncharacterized membrane protein
MARDESFAWLAGVALGAAAMYFLDPQQGRRRRALARDQTIHAANAASEAVERLAEDAGNRAQGTLARARRIATARQPVEEQRLHGRVRSALGRLCSHPRAITVEVSGGGSVTLHGPILASEMRDVLTGLRRVPGVRRLESRLTAYSDDARPAALEGGRTPSGMSPDLLQSDVSPTGRLMLAATGGMAIAWGLRRRGGAGVAVGMAGGLLLARALEIAPHLPAAVLRQREVTVRKSVEVAAPVRSVFAFWSSFRNYPRLLPHLREVRESEGGISHWIADGPGGRVLAWDAEVIALEPMRRIEWRSVEGAPARNAGEVTFEELADDRTRVTVRMTFGAPADETAEGPYFGADPARELEEGLRTVAALLQPAPAAIQSLHPDLAADSA